MEGRIAEVSGSSKTALSLAGSAWAPPKIGTPRAGGLGLWGRWCLLILACGLQ